MTLGYDLSDQHEQLRETVRAFAARFAHETSHIGREIP